MDLENREYLMSLLNYNQLTGLFTWKVNRRQMKKGQIAGNIATDGYRQIMVNYKTYRAARLAWMFVKGEWPAGYIDHINGIRSDDRISNLRDVTQRFNNSNTNKHRTGKLVGAVYHEDGRKNPWEAQIKINGKHKSMGFFDTEQKAHEAYIKELQLLESVDQNK